MLLWSCTSFIQICVCVFQWPPHSDSTVEWATVTQRASEPRGGSMFLSEIIKYINITFQTFCEWKLSTHRSGSGRSLLFLHFLRCEKKRRPQEKLFFFTFFCSLSNKKKKTVLYTFLFPFSYSHHWVCTVSSSFRSLCPPIDRLLGLFALLLRLLVSPSSTSGVICSQKLKCRASMSRYSTDTNARISVAFCTNAMIWLKMTIYMKIILKLYRSRPDEGRSSLSL